VPLSVVALLLGGVLILGVTQVTAAEVLECSGAYDDGWCEPVLQCKVRVSQATKRCQLGFWLKPELNRESSNFTIAVNGQKQFHCAVPYDVETVVQVACPAAPGETLTIDVSCDTLVVDKGIDLRALSYRLTSLSFS
jgi:hypothetical protein